MLLVTIPVSFIAYFNVPSDTVVSVASLISGVIPLFFVAAMFKPIEKLTSRIVITGFKRKIKKRNEVHSVDNLLLTMH